MDTAPPEVRIEIARLNALRSPCQKSRRGAVMWSDQLQGVGFNGLLGGQVCTGDEACRAVCGRRCIHAEQAALLHWSQLAELRELHPAVLRQMLHVKVDDAGLVVASGPPSCMECAKLILFGGVQIMWLLHEAGWRAYTAFDFYRETQRFMKGA